MRVVDIYTLLVFLDALYKMCWAARRAFEELQKRSHLDEANTLSSKVLAKHIRSTCKKTREKGQSQERKIIIESTIYYYTTSWSSASW
jgi:hypothetical protein